ncbi:MAG TPA: hypothetical protein VJ438_00175 [Candidatus Nanoarchaeia archaeon]|nr:hypothetical protein [Candidatus Nanoarchaeia archaeon]
MYLVYFMKCGVINFEGLYKDLSKSEEKVIFILKEQFNINIKDYSEYNEKLRSEVSLLNGECDLIYLEVED